MQKPVGGLSLLAEKHYQPQAACKLKLISNITVSKVMV
jgi:hypothetical protein